VRAMPGNTQSDRGQPDTGQPDTGQSDKRRSVTGQTRDGESGDVSGTVRRRRRRAVRAALLLVVLAGGLMVPATAATSRSPRRSGAARWVMAYHVGYQRDLWPAQQIDFANMTHFVVGRVKPNWDGTVRTDFDIDDTNGPVFAAEMAKRARSAKRVPLLMIGGAGEHDAFAASLEPQHRDRFVSELLRLVDQWGYAGLDLDFEPINPVDEPKVEWLASELRRRRPSLVLTVPIIWINPNIDVISPFYVRLAKVVDRINVMSYSMSGEWGWPTWHSSALTGETSSTPSSVSSSIVAYRRAGVPANRLGVGVGFYGQCWTARTGPRQVVAEGKLVAEDSRMTAVEVTRTYAPVMTRVWDAAAQVPYLTSTKPAGPLGCQYVSYEDTQSIGAKGAFVKRNGLGSVIVWTAAQGYDPTTGRNDMLATVSKSIR
jgi:chitinase